MRCKHEKKDKFIKLRAEILLKFPWEIDKLSQDLACGPGVSSILPLNLIGMKHTQAWWILKAIVMKHKLFKRDRWTSQTFCAVIIWITMISRNTNILVE